MPRSARALLCLAVLVVAMNQATPALAQTGAPRRVIVWVEGLTARDLTVCDEARRALCRFGREASVGLLSTRTGSASRSLSAVSASAGVTLGAGARGKADTSGRILSAVRPGVLATATEGPSVISAGDPDVSIGALLAFQPSSGSRPEVLPWKLRASGVADAVARRLGAEDVTVVVDVSQRAAIAKTRNEEPPGGPPTRGMRYLDALLQQVMDRPDLDVVLLSAVPTAERLRLGIHLGLIAYRFDVNPRGALLTSGTTRRAGVVTLMDVAPSLARGDPEPFEVEGRAWETRSVPDPGARLETIEAEIVHSALARHPLTRRAMILAMVAVLMAAFVVATGRGRAGPRSALPRTGRQWITVLLLTGAAAPLAVYVEGILPVSGVLSATLLCAAIATVVGVGARGAFGPARGFAAVCVLTFVVPVVDLLIGTPLAWRSPWAFQIAGGGRFYGVDEGVLGLVVGAHVVAAGILLDRARSARTTSILIAVSFALVAFVLGSPAFGAKFGAPLTAIPTFGVMAVTASGRRLNLGAIAVIAAATIAVTGMMIGVDRLRSEGQQSHVARVTEGKTDIPALVQRKVSSQIRITLTTMWSRAALVFAGALLFLRFRRGDAWDRGLWGLPGLRAAVLASAVGAACAFVFNDGGVVASAPILLYAAAGTLVPLVEPS